MPNKNNFTCPLAKSHHITLDKTIWEDEYEELYLAGEDITIKELEEKPTFNYNDDMVIFLEDNEDHEIEEGE